MALTQEGFWLTIEMRDSGNNKTSKTFQMTAATAAAAETGSIFSCRFYRKFVPQRAIKSLPPA